MTNIHLILTTLGVLAAPSVPRVAVWGDQGHQIVCAIAYQLLSTSDRQELNRLTAQYRRPDGVSYQYFTSACTFPDLARRNARAGKSGWGYFNRFNRWHYLNVPRDIREITEGHCGNNCVLRGIEYHLARASDADLEDWKRAEALFFLGHWVGDIHQPLHVSYADDLGGNNVKPIDGGYYARYHLHNVWDTGIIRKALNGQNWWEYATELRRSISADQTIDWADDSPVVWAQESYDITTQDEVDYCEWQTDPQGEMCASEWHTRDLGSQYQQAFEAIVEQRLQQAGVRLASLIRQALR